MESSSGQLIWTNLEYEHKPKSKDWFWAVGIIGACLGAVAILLNNFLFGVFLILSSFFIIVLRMRHPRAIKYILSEQGLAINQNVIPIKNISSYNIIGNSANQKLVLKINRQVMPIEVLNIGEEISNNIDSYFGGKVMMDEELDEPFIYKLLDRINL